MDDVRKDVAALMNLSGNVSIAPEKFVPYNVKITASSLNIRSGAGTGYKVVGELVHQLD